MTGSIPAGAPAPGTYTLDPERTTIRADVKAMFGLTTVHGTFRLQSGQVSIGADPGTSSVQASVAKSGTATETGIGPFARRSARLPPSSNSKAMKGRFWCVPTS